MAYLYLFPRTAHNILPQIWWLKKNVLYHFWRSKVQNHGVSRTVGSRGQFFHSFFQFLVAMLQAFLVIPISIMSVFSSFVSQGNLSLDLGPSYIIQDDLITRSLITCAKSCFPNKITSTGSGG